MSVNLNSSLTLEQSGVGRGRVTGSHNRDKHIAAVAAFAFALERLLFILYKTLLPSPGLSSLRSSSSSRVYNMGVVSSCCESCCASLLPCVVVFCSFSRLF